MSLSTCKSSTKRLLQALFLQFASSQADQLSPDCQHGLSERQVLHTEGYSSQLKNDNKWRKSVFYCLTNLFKVEVVLMCQLYLHS